MKGFSICKTAAVLAAILCCQMDYGFCARLSLQEAIDMALSQNTELRVVQKGEDSAEAAYRKAKGANGPSVKVGSSIETGKTEGSSHAETSSNRISASLPIYTGGKNQASVESRKIGMKSADLKTERQRENLKLNVIKAYYDAVQAEKTVAVCREAVDNYNAHYTNVSQLYEAGSKARVEVLRATVELSNARYSLISAINLYEVKLAALRNYINIDRNEPLELTEVFSYEKFSDPLDVCLSYAYDHRKDLLMDLYSLEQKELAIKIAKAGYLPSVDLSVGSGISGGSSASWKMRSSVSAGISANWTIFDSGVTKAAVDEAEVDRDVAQLTYDNDREKIDLSLRESYYGMRSAEKQLESTADSVGKAEEDYFIANEKYKAGEGIMLDVLDAQKSLSEAQLNHITAQYDYVRYKAAVENAMGIGLTEREHLAAGQLDRSVEKLDTAAAVHDMEKKIADSAGPSAAKADVKAPVAEPKALTTVSAEQEASEMAKSERGADRE